MIGQAAFAIPSSSELPLSQGLAFLDVPLGIEATSLRPFFHHLSPECPHAFVAGPGASGKTSTLKTWVISLAASNSPRAAQFFLIGLRHKSLHALASLPHVLGSATTLNDLKLLKGQLEEESSRRFSDPSQAERALVIVIDDVHALMNRLRSAADPDLSSFLELLNRCAFEGGDFGLHCLVAGEVDELNAAFEPIIRLPRTEKSGFLLRTFERYDLPMFAQRLPEDIPKPDLPPGRAFSLRHGKLELVQLASPDLASPDGHGPSTTPEWVERIKQRWSKEVSEDGFQGSAETN